MFSKQLIIFEGPDGAGKTTLAKRLASDIGAHYIHLGPFPRVKDGLARLYVEAMMPALLGHRAVVMDRCWMSEVPYGRAWIRPDRIEIRSRILERMAWRCQTTLVLCIPPFDKIRENYLARQGNEFLKNTGQLELVYNYYAGKAFTGLPMIVADPLAERVEEFSQWLQDELATEHSAPHPVKWASSGNLNGKVLLVGEGFGDTAEGDPLYQSPFGSLVGGGCSLWLARELEGAGIAERDLLWTNADQITPAHADFDMPIVALGDVAGTALMRNGVTKSAYVNHPQYHKRFRTREPYELLGTLKRILGHR